MQQKLTDENEIKVFILYILKKLNHPLSYEDIMQLVFDNGYVGYFDFTLIFSMLISSEDIVKISSDSKINLYKITSRGETIVDNLKELIPQTTREKASSSIVRFMEFHKKGLVYDYDIISESGKYIFSCSIKDDEKMLLNLSIVLDEKATAEKMQQNFSKKSFHVYKNILAVLSGDANFIM